jgi:hypothetical protein
MNIMSNEDTVAVSVSTSASGRRHVVRSRAFRIALLVASLGGGGFWLAEIQQKNVASASEASPAASRQKMLEKLEAACSQAQFPETMRDFCFRQAEYARQLPDCAKACQHVAALTPTKASPLF